MQVSDTTGVEPVLPGRAIAGEQGRAGGLVVRSPGDEGDGGGIAAPLDGVERVEAREPRPGAGREEGGNGDVAIARAGGLVRDGGFEAEAVEDEVHGLAEDERGLAMGVGGARGAGRRSRRAFRLGVDAGR